MDEFEENWRKSTDNNNSGGQKKNLEATVEMLNLNKMIIIRCGYINAQRQFCIETENGQL